MIPQGSTHGPPIGIKVDIGSCYWYIENAYRALHSENRDKPSIYLESMDKMQAISCLRFQFRWVYIPRCTLQSSIHENLLFKTHLFKFKVCIRTGKMTSDRIWDTESLAFRLYFTDLNSLFSDSKPLALHKRFRCTRETRHSESNSNDWKSRLQNQIVGNLRICTAFGP